VPDKRYPHHSHDKGYKQLLASKRAFLELLKTFVHEEWTKDIDEDSLVWVAEIEGVRKPVSKWLANAHKTPKSPYLSRLFGFTEKR